MTIIQDDASTKKLFDDYVNDGVEKKPKVIFNPKFEGVEDFKDNLWNKLFLTQTDKNNVQYKIFKSFFNYYIQFKNLNMLDDFKWVIDSKFFDTEEKYQKYKKRNSNYITIFKDDRENGLEFKDLLVSIFKSEFEIFYSDFMSRDKIYSERKDTIESFQDGDKMNGFYSVDEFREKYGKEYFTEIVDGEEVVMSGYIPRGKNTPDDITDLVLKNSPKAPIFHLNPLIKPENFNKDTSNKVIKLRVNIKNKLSLLSNEKIVGNFIYTCPQCGETISLKNYEMAVSTIYHYKCPNKITSSGAHGNVAISSKSYVNGKTLSIYLYEVYVYGLDGELNKNPNYFYSFRDDISKGEYLVDVVNFNGRLVKPEDKESRTIMYGIKRTTPKIIDNLIDKEIGKNLSDVFGVPRHKLIDILGGVINYYKKEKSIYINPKKGGLLQLQLCFSAIAKIYFKNRNFPISVIGDTSISKTYTAKLISQLFDRDAKFTSGQKSQTYAGIYGGINTDVLIGDKKVKMFQDGVASAGLVVFDEAPHFFDLEKEFNDDLKSLHNEWIEVFKIGGRKIRQTYTPLLFSNFSNYHKGNISVNYKDKSYEGEIKTYYWKLIRNQRDVGGFHEVNKSSSDKYISTTNLYLPIQFYENEYLRKTISLVRNLKESRDICWWTGGSIPSQNRFLFDCVVKKNLSSYENPFKDNDSEMEDDVYDLATDDFIKTVGEYIGIIKPINVQRIKENDEDVFRQLRVLKKRIMIFLENNEKINLHFSNGRRIDDKVSKMITELFMIVQLINDFRAVELDSASIDLAEKILLKCKRGLTEQEYNFLNHSYLPNKTIIENEEYLGVDLLDKIEEDDENKRIEEKIIELEKKHSLNSEPENSNEISGKPLDFKDFEG